MRLPAVTRCPAISNGARVTLGLRFFVLTTSCPGAAAIFFDGGTARSGLAPRASEEAVMAVDFFLVIGAERA